MLVRQGQPGKAADTKTWTFLPAGPVEQADPDASCIISVWDPLTRDLLDKISSLLNMNDQEI